MLAQGLAVRATCFAALFATAFAGCASSIQGVSMRSPLDGRHVDVPTDVATLAKYLERNVLWSGDGGLLWVRDDISAKDNSAMGVCIDASDSEMGRHLVSCALTRWRKSACFSRNILSTAEVYAWAEHVAISGDYERAFPGVALTRIAKLKIAWAMSLVTNTRGAGDAIAKVIADNKLDADISEEVFMGLQYQAIMLWCAELVSAKWIEKECRWIELCFGGKCAIAERFYPATMANEFDKWREGKSEAAIEIVSVIQNVSGVRYFSIPEFGNLEGSDFWNGHLFTPMTTLSAGEVSMISGCELQTRVAAYREDETYPSFLTVGQVVNRIYSHNKKELR